MEQLFCLIAFTATGIVIGVLFDIFRILRRSFKTADWLTTLQDILFWILAGFVILFSIFKFNNGEIRLYNNSDGNYSASDWYCITTTYII